MEPTVFRMVVLFGTSASKLFKVDDMGTSLCDKDGDKCLCGFDGTMRKCDISLRCHGGHKLGYDGGMVGVESLTGDIETGEMCMRLGSAGARGGEGEWEGGICGHVGCVSDVLRRWKGGRGRERWMKCGGRDRDRG